MKSRKILAIICFLFSITLVFGGCGEIGANGAERIYATPPASPYPTVAVKMGDGIERYKPDEKFAIKFVYYSEWYSEDMEYKGINDYELEVEGFVIHEESFTDREINLTVSGKKGVEDYYLKATIYTDAGENGVLTREVYGIGNKRGVFVSVYGLDSAIWDYLDCLEEKGLITHEENMTAMSRLWDSDVPLRERYKDVIYHLPYSYLKLKIAFYALVAVVVIVVAVVIVVKVKKRRNSG